MTGPKAGNFQNLVIWSENTAGVSNNAENQLGSQNKLALEGILFLPNALVNFGGNPTYLGSARAQFVAWQDQYQRWRNFRAHSRSVQNAHYPGWRGQTHQVNSVTCPASARPPGSLACTGTQLGTLMTFDSQELYERLIPPVSPRASRLLS